MNNTTLFVISDIHAFDGGKRTKAGNDANQRMPSFYDISQLEQDRFTNPISTLKELIKREDISAQYLVCCGDLGDQADADAIRKVWEDLQDIKKQLRAKTILTTVGNHDVDSRYNTEDYDARGFLRDLTPTFPFDEKNQNNQFWSEHFVVIRDPDFPIRFIVVDSTAYHGNKKEHEHGRIADRTLKAIVSTVESQGLACPRK